METRCSERVFISGELHLRQCRRKAVVKRDGRPYCKTHDPEYIKKKNELTED